MNFKLNFSLLSSEMKFLTYYFFQSRTQFENILIMKTVSQINILILFKKKGIFYHLSTEHTK